MAKPGRVQGIHDDEPFPLDLYAGRQRPAKEELQGREVLADP